MVWRADAPQGLESDKIAHLVVPYVRGNGIDIGCGTRTVWPHAVGVDTGHHFGRGAATIILPSFESVRLPFGDGALDFAFSSHCLEHVVDFKMALAEWWRVVRPGGWLTLYLPHKDFYPNIGQLGHNPDHKHDFIPADIIDAMKEIAAVTGRGWNLLEDEDRNGTDEYSFFQVYQKRGDRLTLETPWRRPEGKKTALVIRYGDAIGDHILAASVLPGLKKQGYHVTMNCTPTGAHVLEHDPHIDAWWMQEKGEIPIEYLGVYFAALKAEGRWDRIVNFTECIETQLLTHPKNPRDLWPDEVRRAVCGTVSYLEITHDYAAVPYDFAPRFFPSPAERKAAHEWRVRLGADRPLIGFPLVGSSFHKVYPHLDRVLAWTLQRVPEAICVLFGDGKRGRLMADAMTHNLAHNGIPTDRVIVHCGDLDIRDALARSRLCNVLVGAETGLMWGSAFEPAVRKVLFLSHSSEANFKHWPGTVFMKPKGAACHPCHRMHYFDALERCTVATWQDEAKTLPMTAACCENVDPDKVATAIVQQLRAAKVRLSMAAAE